MLATLLLVGLASAQPAEPLAPRTAHHCYTVAHPVATLAYEDGETRVLCTLPIASPGRDDVRAEVWETRQGDRGLIQTLTILSGDQTLWTRSSTGMITTDVIESFADVVSFTPRGESYGQVALLLTRCGAYCGGSALIVLDVRGDQARELLSVDGGPDPALLVVGSGLIVSWQDRAGPAYATRGTLNSQYAWSSGAYHLVDTVLEESGLPNTGP